MNVITIDDMEGAGMINGALVQQEGRKLWQYLATLSACLSTLAMGTILIWPSPVLPQLEDPQAWLHVSIEQGSWVSSLMAIGAIVVALPSGILIEKFGRKIVMLSVAACLLLSWLGIIFARYVWMLYVARIVAGFGVGTVSIAVPVYIAEIAEASSRGSLGSFFTVMMSTGILFGYVVGATVSYTWFAITCAMINVIFVGTFIWMPESPQWLVGRGRKAEASKALGVLRGDAYDLNGELAEMQRVAEEQAARNGTIFDLVKTRGARMALSISLGLMAFQQLSGFTAIMTYSVSIMRVAASWLDPNVAVMIIVIVQVAMTGLAVLFVDKVGRKPLLVVSSSAMGLCLVVLGVFFKLQSNGSDVSKFGWIPLTSLTFFMIAFSIGYGPIPWMMMGELFPAETKGIASGLAGMTNWTFGFVAIKIFPTLEETFGQAETLWVFAAIMGIAAVFSIFVVPETKRKSLQQIQDDLNGVKKSRLV